MTTKISMRVLPLSYARSTQYYRHAISLGEYKNSTDKYLEEYSTNVNLCSRSTTLTIKNATLIRQLIYENIYRARVMFGKCIHAMSRASAIDIRVLRGATAMF